MSGLEETPFMRNNSSTNDIDFKSNSIESLNLSALIDDFSNASFNASFKFFVSTISLSTLSASLSSLLSNHLNTLQGLRNVSSNHPLRSANSLGETGLAHKATLL